MQKNKTLLIQIGLFLATILTTTLAGAEWMFGRSFLDFASGMGLSQFLKGFQFTFPFLLFLTVHELGHYFMAKRRNVSVTLPYYIPIWLGFITSIGTAGAFIKIKDRISSKINYFDIGIAGPLAGFVVSIITLWYGFSHLPPIDYIFQIHPEYAKYGANYGKFVYTSDTNALAIHLGDNIIFNYLKDTFANPALLPHPNEITHYPILFAGYLGLFFTALNLIPIGQLDGGHILFGLIGDKNFKIVSPILFSILVLYSGLGLFTYKEFILASEDEYWTLTLKFLFYIYFIYLCFSRVFENPMKNVIIALSVVLFQLISSYYFEEIAGYSGFLAFSFLIGRVLGVYHPPVEFEEKLGFARILLGWLTLLIFIGCFSLQPLN